MAAVITRASSRPGRISAKAAPPSPPIATGKLTLTASAHGSTLRWEKLTVAESAPIRTGTRLVALAEIGSSPIIIRMGKDTAEPDDAAVLRKPQDNPAPTPSTGRAAGSCPILLRRFPANAGQAPNTTICSPPPLAA